MDIKRLRELAGIVGDELLAEDVEIIIVKPDGTPYTREEFNTAFDTFMKGAQHIVDTHTKDLTGGDPDSIFKKTLVADTKGKRYIRISVQSKSQTSAWAFIDKATGDVLKPAGWKAPAKGSRGNIFDEHNGLKRISWTGPAYNK